VKSICNGRVLVEVAENKRMENKIKILINKINGKKYEPVANYTN
jgi:hypothetical protein